MNASPETAPGPLPGPADHELFLACLEQVVASTAFSGARRQQRFLRYLVERTVAGDTSALKEYSLGIEVFERGAEFDPRLDPIVRVEASRLRNRLQKYYQSNPPGITRRIELPRGGYVPVLALVHEAEPEPEAAVPPAPRRRWLYPAVAAVVVLLGLVAVLLLRRPEAPFGHFTRLSRELGRANSPSLSPDGQWVVYAARIDGDWEILLRSSDGHTLRNLSAEPRFTDRHPAFSPDGRQVAFQSGRQGGGLYVVSVEGGTPRRVAPRGNHPTWAPDGTRLAYCTGSFDEPGEDAPYRRSSIGVVDLKSGAIREWSSPGEVPDALQPAWSADGAWIAFWGHDHHGQVDLWTLPVALPAGREATRVLSDPYIDWSPRFSPDGNWLYYSSNRSGPLSLWRVRFQRGTGTASGTPEPVVTPSSNSGGVTLSSDGRRLAYVRRLNYSRLFRAPFDPVRGVLTGEPVALTSGERRFREPSLSPDGAWLAAHTQDPQDDIVLLKPDGSGLRRLTDDAHLDRIPLWAPDGRSLVFNSTRGGSMALWSIQADGTGLRQICADGHATPLWLPDGTLLVVPDPPGLPQVISPPGRAIPPAFANGAGIRPIEVAPDGLHYTARMPGTAALGICAMSGGDCWRAGPHVSTPVWIRGGQALLFFTNNSFHLADLATRTTRLVYRPTQGELHPRLATDGKSLFFAQREDEEDVWIAERAAR